MFYFIMDLIIYSKIKYPLIFLDKLSKQDISDNLMFMTIKYFFRFHHNKIQDLKIIKLFDKLDKEKYKKTIAMIVAHDYLLEENVINFTNIRKYAGKIPKKLLYSSIENNIKYWENKLIKINAINDSSFGEGFHLKVLGDIKNEPKKSKKSSKNICYDYSEEIILKKANKKNLNTYTNEMIERMYNIKNILGTSFFRKHKIILFSKYFYIDIEYKNQIKIYFKFILKVLEIIKSYIADLKKLKHYRDLLLKLYN